jgi:hypothetical protein
VALDELGEVRQECGRPAWQARASEGGRSLNTACSGRGRFY